MTRAATPLALPLGISLALHAGAGALLFFVHAPEDNREQQPYMAHLLAAPAGPRASGLVPTEPVKEAAKAASVKSAPVRNKTPETVKVPTASKAKPVAAPRKETATTDVVKSVKANAADPTDKSKSKAAEVPKVAGGGPVGSTGTDVANVLFHGIEFADQRYLNNIVGRIAEYFKPIDNFALVAEFSFDINRRGCMQNLKLVKGSGISSFDAEAKAAIDVAGRDCGFNPLPAVWPDDILSIRFRFDPKIIKK